MAIATLLMSLLITGIFSRGHAQSSTSASLSAGSGSQSATATASSTGSMITAAPSSSGGNSTSALCLDGGYTPCPNQKFCCASGDYCFYDNFLSARCFSDATYTFYYSYSWSYTFGLAYFTTYTEVDLTSATKNVVTLTTPPPPATIPNTIEAVPPGPTATETTAGNQTATLATLVHATTTIPMTETSRISKSAGTVVLTTTFESTSTMSGVKLLAGVNATDSTGLFIPFQSSAPTESDPGDGFSSTATAPTKSGAATGSNIASTGIAWMGALLGLVAFW